MGDSLLNVQAPSHPGLHLGRVLPQLALRLLPLPANAGRGKSVEVSLPLSQLQVGGILGWHWHSWSSFGAEEVLHSGYIVFFHRLSPVLRELLKFPFTPQGLPRLKHFREKWTECFREAPWNWWTICVWMTTVPLE